MFHSSEQESLWKSWDLLVGKQVQKGGIVEIGDLTWFNQWKGRLETFWWFFLDIPIWKKQESSTLKSAGCFPSNVLHPYHSCPCWSAQLFEHPTPTAIYSPKRDLAPIEVTSKQLWRPQVKGVRRPMHRELLLFGTQTSMTSKYKLCKFDLCQSCTETKFVRIFSLVHDYVTMNYEYDHFNRVSVFSICRSGRSNAPCGDQNCDGKRGNTFLPFKACKLMSDHKHTTPKIALVIQQETQSTWQSTV